MSVRKTYLKAALLVIIISLTVVLFLRTDYASYMSSERLGETFDTLRSWFHRYGPYGPPLYWLAGFAAVCINVPTFCVVYFAVLLYGGVGGMLLGSTAALTAVACVFLLGRRLGREFVLHLFGRHIHKFEHYCRRQGFMMVFSLRLLFFMMPPLNWMLSLTGVSTRDYLLGTWLGTLHGFVLQAWMASYIIRLIEEGRSLNPLKTPQMLIPIGVGVALFLAVTLLKKRWETPEEGMVALPEKAVESGERVKV